MGDEAALLIERGGVLRGGDRLRADDGRIVMVEAAGEEVLRVSAADPRDLTRAAYRLSNRHVPLQIGPGWLRLASDHVLEDMLLGLGVVVSPEIAPFDPEAGAYGGGHHHHDDDDGHMCILRFANNTYLIIRKPATSLSTARVAR